MSNTQKWQIRQALPREVEYLSGLAFRSKSYWGYSDRFMQECLEELTVDAYYIENNPTFVIEEAGNTVGFYSLEHISASEVELSLLFVDPAFIGTRKSASIPNRELPIFCINLDASDRP